MSPELRLITRAADGDDHAYETWLAGLRPALVRYARDRLGAVAQTEAEDVVQDASMRALLALREGRIPANPRAWMFVIVRNRCHDVRSATRAADPLDTCYDVASREPGPDEVAAGRRQMGAVVDAIGALPDNQRRALVGATFEGRPYEEIAAREATTVQAIKSLVHRARRNLESTGARAAAFVPGLVAVRLRARAFAGAAGESRDQLLGLISQHTAAAASAAALAAVAVPAVTIAPPLSPAKQHHAAVAATPPPASAAPTATAGGPAAVAPPQTAKAVLAVCHAGKPLAGFHVAALEAARHSLPSSEAEYGGGCASALDAALNAAMLHP